MVTIYYTFFQYKDWDLLLAATNKGLCYIGFQERTIDDLLKVCKKQFNQCTFVEDENELIPYINQLKDYFDGVLTTFTIPIHFHGTDFQRKVWNTLLSIPYGKTVSYSEIASSIQNPKAIRAVGTAIGKNPIPIVIPCHRVIGKNGSLLVVTVEDYILKRNYCQLKVYRTKKRIRKIKFTNSFF